MMPFLLLSPRAQAGILAVIVVVDIILLGYYFRDRFQERVAWEIWNRTRLDGLALAVASNSNALRQSIAYYYFNEGDYDLEKSKAQLQELYDNGLRDYVTIYQLARIYFINGRYDIALDLLDENLWRYPEWKRTYYTRGLVHTYRGQFEAAEKDFKAFLEWKSDEWPAYNDLAWVQLKAGKYEESLETAVGALVHFPDNLWLNNTAGVAAWNAGDLEAAERFLENAQDAVQTMSVDVWGSAYPGNNPATYESSLTAMRDAVAQNLAGVRAESAPASLE
jgi:tetratricopeptide (TPR) repeat protein